MGRRAQQRQEPIWIAHTELPQTVAHPFYERLDQVLEERGFDAFVEQRCAGFYAERMGRPSLAPGPIFPLVTDGVFRRHRQRARDGMAGGGFAGPAQFSGSGLGGDAAGSLHDIAHAAADRCACLAGSNFVFEP